MKPVVHPWAPWNRGDLLKLIIRAVRVASNGWWPKRMPEIFFEISSSKMFRVRVLDGALFLAIPQPRQPRTPLEFLASLSDDPVMSGEDAQAIAQGVAVALDPDGIQPICSWARTFRIRRHKPSAQGIGGVQ